MSESRSAPLGQHTTPSSGWTLTLRNSSGSRSGAKTPSNLMISSSATIPSYAVFKTNLEAVRGKCLDQRRRRIEGNLPAGTAPGLRQVRLVQGRPLFPKYQCIHGHHGSPFAIAHGKIRRLMIVVEKNDHE